MAWGPLTPRHAQDSSLDSLFARTVSPDILLPWDKVLFEGLSVPPWHCQRSRAGVCSHGVRIWGQFSHSPDLTGTVLLCSPPQSLCRFLVPWLPWRRGVHRGAKCHH